MQVTTREKPRRCPSLWTVWARRTLSPPAGAKVLATGLANTEAVAAGKKVYWFMWKCFQSADIDRDGLVSQEEFDKMILMATSAITRLDTTHRDW